MLQSQSYASATEALRAASVMLACDRELLTWPYRGTVVSVEKEGFTIEARITALNVLGPWVVAARLPYEGEQIDAEDALSDAAAGLALLCMGEKVPEMPVTMFTKGGYFAWPEGSLPAGVIGLDGQRIVARQVEKDLLAKILDYLVQKAAAIDKAVRERNVVAAETFERQRTNVALEWLRNPASDPLRLRETTRLRRP